MDFQLIAEKIKTGEMVLDGNKLYTAEQYEAYKHAKHMEEHYDLLQLTKKISLNSAYGALLSIYFRFGDERLGASITASGRQITKHMIIKVGTLLCGRPIRLIRRFTPFNKAGNGSAYVDGSAFNPCNDFENFAKAPLKPIINIDKTSISSRAKETRHDASARWLMVPRVKSMPSYFTVAVNEDGSYNQDEHEYTGIIYCDTDSVHNMLPDDLGRDESIELADAIGDEINASYPDFAATNFFCSGEFLTYLGAARELVGDAAIYFAKKKYIIKVIDLEGVAVDKLKTMGSEIKKADTPKDIQQFLETVNKMILEHKTLDEVSDFVIQKRNQMCKADMTNSNEIFLYGVAKQVNDIQKFEGEYERPGSTKKIGRALTIPGHVRAALNYNTLVTEHDRTQKLIASGDKAVVFYLQKNTYDFDSIAFPSEMETFPSWFIKSGLSIDMQITMEKMIDSKLESLFKIVFDLNSVPSAKTKKIASLLSF